MRDQHSHPTVLHHVSETVMWKGRIQGYVGTAGLQDAQKANYHLHGTFHTQAYQHIRPNAEPFQMMRKLVCALVKHAVGHFLLIKYERYMIGGFANLCFN